MANQVEPEHLPEYIACNFMYQRDPKLWVNSLLTPEAQDNFLKFQKYRQSSSYLFGEDLKKFGSLKSVLKVPKDRAYPELFQIVLSGDIAVETLLIMNHFIGFLPVWYEKIEEEFMFPKYKILFDGYQSFVTFAADSCKKILLEKYKSS